MKNRAWTIAGLALVLASMVALFAAPKQDFVALTFVATSCMMLGSYALGVRWRLRMPSPRVILAGVASGVVLYMVFFVGSIGITVFHPFGIVPGNESSIYLLIASPSNPIYLQVAVLVFDSAGYESFFRGGLQTRLQTRLGAGAAPAVAALDAAVHVLTFNPLWIATTFIADLSWGLTFHYSKSLAAPFVSHLLWDLAIFVVFPIR